MTSQQDDRAWAKAQVERYAAVRSQYVQFADLLESVLKQAVKKHSPETLVQVRAKQVASFAGKILRKRSMYTDAVNDLTDLCGARVITTTKAEAQEICKFIEEHFDIDWENSADSSQRHKTTEFGYMSMHYIVSFRRDEFPTDEVKVDVPDEVFEMENQRAEVQVRTFLEHAWAVFAHDTVYKSQFEVPAQWERETAGVAAMVEAAGNAFERVRFGLEAYEANYGAYMTEDQMRGEIERLELVLEHDDGNVALADQIGRLAVALGDWPKAIDVLAKYVDTGDTAVLRDLGHAMCKQHKASPQSSEYRQGQAYLETASAPPSRDVDAIATLAGTWKGVDEDQARELYGRAFEVDPTNPYPLGCYLESEIAHERSAAPLVMLKPTILEAIKRCRTQADVGMNMPWAFYDSGKFELLLGNANASLAAYAKAIRVTNAAFMIETSLGSLDRLSAIAHALPGLELGRRFLRLGSASKFPAEQTAAEIMKAASAGLEPIQGPVVVVAGGCDAEVEKHMQEYRALLLEAFRGFRGTIISGGTAAGISGLVGDVQQANPDSIRALGYVPKLMPADVTLDSRYAEIRKTDGTDFTVLESLQYWADLLASGVKLSDVKVIGINGGSIAAAEYRIAMALGADVGIVEGSGREAGKLLQDSDWGTDEHLLPLPADPATLRAFVGPGAAQLDEALREPLAQSIHEEYRHNQMEEARTASPSTAPWADLSEHLKESNRAQADHISEKLQAIGCEVHEAKDGNVTPMAFTDEEVETLSEIEHARWNIERIQDGWRLGEEKDVEKKISPYLVSWEVLPDSVREWDRQTVRAIPEFLATVGMEVRRKA